MTVFVLVHGAWGGAHGFRRVRGPLRAAGHEVFTPSLTGIGERAHLTSPQVCLTTHVTDVVNTVLYEDLGAVVLLGFSYGGFVVTGALEHIAERVRHLVYLDAFVPDDGDTVDAAGGMGAGYGVTGLGRDWLVPPLSRPERPWHDLGPNPEEDTMSDQIQPWPLVKRGSQGHPVPALQYLLRERGHPVTVDGISGPKTEAAVENFQTADQLKVDGIVGPQTWGALVIVVTSGSTGDAVRGVQEEFRFRNLSGNPGLGLAVDGVFGPKTRVVVRGFQQALGITVDGIVGPLTWRALVSGMLSF